MNPETETWTLDGRMGIRTRPDLGDTCVIEVVGELDLATADLLASELLRAERTEVSRILVDLRSLEFMDSSGIRVLHDAQARSATEPGRLSFIRGTGQVDRIMSLTRMDERLAFTV